MFNSFLNIYLRYIYACFPKLSVKVHITKKKMWISPGIKLKCNIKRYFYLTSRDSDDPNIKICNKAYRKSLVSEAVKTKRLYYNKQILNSNDRIKSTWNIVKMLTGNK
jgi:hypothetical protein